MTWYLLWKYKYWIAIAVLSFICVWMSSQLNKADAEKEEAVAAAIKPYEDAAKTHTQELEKASEQYEKLKSEQRVKTETVTREVQKIVERPVYLNQCFDDDGLSAINSHITSDTS